MGITTSAFSESYKITETSSGVLRCGKALILETPNMSKEKPTLLFFGGKGERSSARKTAKLLENVTVYENWNVCYIAVSRDNGYIREWRDVADSLYYYIEQRIKEKKINPYNIYIDGYSNGSAGAFYTTLKLHNMRLILDDVTATVKVRELTLIEGTLPGIIKPPQIEQILSMNIPMTLYVSAGSSYNLSAHGRDLVKKFKNRENFTGILVDHGHGSAIVALVSNAYGNHTTDGY